MAAGSAPSRDQSGPRLPRPSACLRGCRRRRRRRWLRRRLGRRHLGRADSRRRDSGGVGRCRHLLTSLLLLTGGSRDKNGPRDDNDMPCGHCGAIRCEDSAHVHKSEAVAGPPIQGRNRESGLMCARGGAPQGRRERARDARAPQAATCAQLPTQGQGARANVRGLVLTSPPPLPSLRPPPPQHYTPQQTPTSWPTVPSTAARAIESLRNTATADTAGDSGMSIPINIYIRDARPRAERHRHAGLEPLDCVAEGETELWPKATSKQAVEMLVHLHCSRNTRNKKLLACLFADQKCSSKSTDR